MFWQSLLQQRAGQHGPHLVAQGVVHRDCLAQALDAAPVKDADIAQELLCAAIVAVLHVEAVHAQHGIRAARQARERALRAQRLCEYEVAALWHHRRPLVASQAAKGHPCTRQRQS